MLHQEPILTCIYAVVWLRGYPSARGLYSDTSGPCIVAGQDETRPLVPQGRLRRAGQLLPCFQSAAIAAVASLGSEHQSRKWIITATLCKGDQGLMQNQNRARRNFQLMVIQTDLHSAISDTVVDTLGNHETPCKAQLTRIYWRHPCPSFASSR